MVAVPPDTSFSHENFVVGGATAQASTMGPEAGNMREVNYCNYCCDQVQHYCAHNNAPVKCSVQFPSSWDVRRTGRHSG